MWNVNTTLAITFWKLFSSATFVSSVVLNSKIIEHQVGRLHNKNISVVPALSPLNGFGQGQIPYKNS